MSSNKKFSKEMLQIITIGQTHLTESLYCCKDLRKKIAPFSYIWYYYSNQEVKKSTYNRKSTARPVGFDPLSFSHGASFQALSATASSLGHALLSTWSSSLIVSPNRGASSPTMFTSFPGCRGGQLEADWHHFSREFNCPITLKFRKPKLQKFITFWSWAWA